MTLKDKKIPLPLALTAVVLVLLFSLGFYIYAALPPITSYSPVDTGPVLQTKTGGLVLNTKTPAQANGLFVAGGNVGIGVESTVAKLDLGGSGTFHFAPQASDPTGSAATSGTIYYNSSSKAFRYHDGSTWNNLGSSSSDVGYVSQVWEIDFQLCKDHPEIVCIINTEFKTVNCDGKSPTYGVSDPQASASYVNISRSGISVPAIKNLQTVHAGLIGMSGVSGISEWTGAKIEITGSNIFNLIVTFNGTGHGWVKLKYSVEALGYATAALTLP